MILQVFKDHQLFLGRLIAPSKSQYRMDHPGHNVVFNANVFTLEDGLIWSGDLDLTLDSERLQIIAEKINKKIYVTREFYGNLDEITSDNFLQHSIWQSK